MKGFCWHSTGSSTVASRPPWRGLTLLAQDTEVKAKEQEEALVLRLDELEFSRPGPSPPPPLPSGASGGRQRGTVSARVLVFICASSTKARPHRWKGGCVRVVRGSDCVGAGKGMKAHIAAPTHSLRGGSRCRRWGKRATTSCHLPNLSPCLPLGSGKVEEEGRP